MSGVIPDIIGASELSRFFTGKTVFGTDGLSVSEKIAWLTGRCVECVASCSAIPYEVGTTLETRIAYAPSPGAQVLLIEIQPNLLYGGGSTTGVSPTYTVDLTTGALNGGAWIGETKLDGDTLRIPTLNLTQVTSFVGLVDLTSVTKGIVSEPTIKITSTDIAPFRVFVTEIPLANYDPGSSATEEIGVDPGSFASGTSIVGGSSSYGQGFYRIVKGLEQARKDVRRHMQFFHFQQDTAAEQHFRVTNKAAFTDLIEANSAVTGTIFKFYCRARRLYGTSTANKYKVIARFKATNSTSPQLRVAVTPSGGATTNNDFTLTGTGSWATFVAGSNIDIPNSGTDQIVEVEFKGKVVNTGDYLTFSMVALVENES